MCDIFAGIWVEDDTYPLYQSSGCPVIDPQFNCQLYGRSDSCYQRYRFDGVELLTRMRGKTVMFVGDTLGRNQWESLICMLYAAVPQSRTQMMRGDPLSTLKFLMDDHAVLIFPGPVHCEPHRHVSWGEFHYIVDDYGDIFFEIFDDQNLLEDRRASNPVTVLIGMDGPFYGELRNGTNGHKDRSYIDTSHDNINTESTVTSKDFQDAEPDALAHCAPAIVERINMLGMNCCIALKSLCRKKKGLNIEEANLVGVDSLGMDVRVFSGMEAWTVRFSFNARVMSETVAERNFQRMLFPRYHRKNVEVPTDDMRVSSC